MRFLNREQAGQQLATALNRFKGINTVVLALPRGGIVLASEVASYLGVPLGLVQVRKLGHPFDPEYAIGAVAEDAQPILNHSEATMVDKRWIEKTLKNAREEIKLRQKLYYVNNYTQPGIKNKTVILIDDGIATGLTMEAAVRYVASKKSKKIIVAAPVASRESVEILQELVDEVVVLDDPDNFLNSVGAHYERFEQVDNQEVIDYLQDSLNR